MSPENVEMFWHLGVALANVAMFWHLGVALTNVAMFWHLGVALTNVAMFWHLGVALTNQNCTFEKIKSRQNPENAYCDSVQNVLSSCLTSKDTQDRIYRPTAFPLFMQV
jgi:hypothetical protein